MGMNMATEQSSSFLFYAHTKEGCSKDGWQLLNDHLRNVDGKRSDCQPDKQGGRAEHIQQ